MFKGFFGTPGGGEFSSADDGLSFVGEGGESAVGDRGAPHSLMNERTAFESMSEKVTARPARGGFEAKKDVAAPSRNCGKTVD